jgi:hypothetical protein
MRPCGFVGVVLTSVCAFWVPFGSAEALSPSGEALAVVQSTSVSGPGGSRVLGVSKPIYSGDRINTGQKGEAQILFLDNTKLVVGPNSAIVIDKFVYNPDKTLASVGLQMTKGAFRFITGNGPKRAYSIQTPTATLAVRGTKFDVAVGGKFGTGILVFDGAVEMCNRITGNCTVGNRGCGAAVASPDGSLNSPRSAEDTTALIRAAFPLVSRQGALRTDFRVDSGECGNLATPPAAGAPALKQINFSPVAPIDPVTPPVVSGGINPGASGSTSGSSHSSSSSASSTSRSGPGKSASSNAGGKGKGKNKKN